MRKGAFEGALFLYFATCLIFSITLTIKTNPGSIPDDKEWDMVSDTNGDNGSDSDREKSSQEGDHAQKEYLLSLHHILDLLLTMGLRKMLIIRWNHLT